MADEGSFDNPNIDNRLRYFTYYPANVYPEVSLGVYFVVGTILMVQTIRARAAGWVFILAGTAYAEFLGYVFRTVCVYNTTFAMYVVMTLFLLLPPNALALANYKTVGEIIKHNPNVATQRFWLRPRFVNWFYFSSDLFSILMQGAGGGMMTKMSSRDAGKTIVLIGLTVQLFFFACFLVTAVFVWRRPYEVYAGNSSTPQAAKNRVLGVVSATTVILYMRSIYRIAEFADGYGGKIYRAEWAFYVFDTILVFLAFVVYIVVFIGHNFPRGEARQRIDEPKYDESSANLVYN
ncbi:hypothetical protein GGI25_005652 [Coemansia spiralis]|uniref:RTA1 like protein n=2 Tax=Coemansia TaxID=4863 RepID=A0A9W8G4A5_9FUNG|nr:RTA1 like protein-domain-containing protein [Coemansia spiralis]KAJ1987666.1 hypothetical protein EDC05_005711 [Coemansia umbellata]KAJ2618875.1 hypothetical protein GGI26_006285 [Coemansia sp. RSA 1358]KAJ2671003.1 hypothetical protein GGI25_005652 [Coemansia spiralis]